jgi:hypothetical protein
VRQARLAEFREVLGDEALHPLPEFIARGGIFENDRYPT